MERLGHRPALDGIRGIAILAVVGFHFVAIPAGGAYGVDLFFVLSGFLITTLLLEEHQAEGRISLRGFYARRVRRLAPALAALLVVIAAVGPFAFGARQLAEILASSLYAANFVRAFAATDVLAGGPAGHLWSLAQEEQFYLLWPPLLIALLMMRASFKTLLVGAVAAFVGLCVYRYGLAAGGESWSRLYFRPDVRADGLVLGCAAAFARATGLRPARAFGWSGLVVFVVGCLLAHPATVASQVRLLPVVELGGAFLVLGSLRDGTLARLLAFGPLAWVGAISYSLYLWHEFGLWAAGSNPWLAVALTVPLTLGSYYGVERPFRRRRTMVRSESAAPATSVSPAVS